MTARSLVKWASHSSASSVGGCAVSLTEDSLTLAAKSSCEGQERDVNVSLPASGDDISSHQSADAQCSTKAKIIGTF